MELTMTTILCLSYFVKFVIFAARLGCFRADRSLFRHETCYFERKNAEK